jgi:hypothetical protein
MTVPMVMYKAVDKLDNKMSFFAVRGDMMSVSSYGSATDPWLSPKSEKDIETDTKFCLDRMQNPITLLWSSEDKPTNIPPHITDSGSAKLQISGKFDEDKDVSILIDQGFSSSIFHLSAEELQKVSHHIQAVLETAPLKVTMYKAVDRGDRQLSYFAVRGERMATTFVLPVTSYWSEAETFGDFDDCKSSAVDFTRMVNPEVIWSQ